MSFAAEARKEIAHVEVDQLCCAKSELAAALIASGGVSLVGMGAHRLSLSAPEATTVRRYFSLIKRFFGVTGELRLSKSDRLGGHTRYQLALPDERARELLQAAGLYDPQATFGVRPVPDERECPYSCCRIAFLRAAFLFCGTVSNPEKAYHIEFVAPNEQFAQTIMEKLRYFEIRAKNTCRKTKEVIYLKGSEEVADVLTLLGAHGCVLALENTRIAKEVRNGVNRQLNCDSSNINRAMFSAEKQIADIRFIESELGLDRLPRTLRVVAEARLGNPDIPLAGLGELLTPPLGKSGVNARMRRLTDMAERLRAGEKID